jgi:hypothetical protein
VLARVAVWQPAHSRSSHESSQQLAHELAQMCPLTLTNKEGRRFSFLRLFLYFSYTFLRIKKGRKGKEKEKKSEEKKKKSPPPQNFIIPKRIRFFTEYMTLILGLLNKLLLLFRLLTVPLMKISFLGLSSRALCNRQSCLEAAWTSSFPAL